MLNLNQQDAQHVFEPVARTCSTRALRSAVRRFLRLAAQDSHESIRKASKDVDAVVAALQR